MKRSFSINSIFCACLLLILLNISCEKNPTPLERQAPAIELQVEEVMVTEAWLKLRVQNLQPNQQAVVWRDSLEIFRSGNVKDTVLYDSALQPAHSYNYHAAIFYNQQPIANSQKLNFTTMDTTSRNFTWEIEELETTYSELFDVAINGCT